MPYSHYKQIQPFINFLKFEKRYSKHTIISYQNDLKQFFVYIICQFDAPAITDISPGFVRSWLAGLKNAKLTAKSINRKISTLNSFFKYQIKVGELSKSPMTIIVTPKVSKRLPTFVTEADMEKLKGIQFTEDWVRNTDQLIIQILYSTGMRLSELIQLKESHIDISYSQVKVLGKGNKERIIPISTELLKNICEYINHKQAAFPGVPDPHLLLNNKGRPLYAKYVYRLVNQNLTVVTTLKKRSPHVLRHTFATHLTNGGADLHSVKELLGHSSLAATQIYTHNTIDKLKDIHKKAHPKA